MGRHRLALVYTRAKVVEWIAGAAVLLVVGRVLRLVVSLWLAVAVGIVSAIVAHECLVRLRRHRDAE